MDTGKYINEKFESTGAIHTAKSLFASGCVAGAEYQKGLYKETELIKCSKCSMITDGERAVFSEALKKLKEEEKCQD